jgi:hypothetical protein
MKKRSAAKTKRVNYFKALLQGQRGKVLLLPILIGILGILVYFLLSHSLDFLKTEPPSYAARGANPRVDTTTPPIAVIEGESFTWFAEYAQHAYEPEASGSLALLVYNSANASINLATNVNRVGITTRKRNCTGVPTLLVKVNGSQIMDLKINSSTWSDDFADIALPAGTHNLEVVYVDTPGGQRCARSLLVDKVSFY